MALFVCSALVPFLMKWAPALGLVDLPEERKVHSNPIPRAGGVAIVVAFFVPVLVWYQGGQSVLALLVGAAVIALFGFLDDRHNLPYQWKFLAQILAVAIFLSGNLEINKTPFLGLGDPIPWISYPLLALFILGVTNAVNLSDGLDGLAAGTSLLSLGLIAVLSYTFTDYGLALLAVACMGSIAGFLRFNTHPATIFMGDTGSQFLGFMTASLAVLMTQSESAPVSPILAVLIVGLPILDTLMVIVLRLRNGLSPFQPDRRHMHHQLLSAGLEHYQAVALIYVCNVVLLGLAYHYRYAPDFLVAGVYIAFSAALLFGIYLLARTSFARQRGAASDGLPERRNPFFRKLGWFHAKGETLVQLSLGACCIAYAGAGSLSDVAFAPLAVLAALPLFLFWCFSSTHSALLNRLMIYSTCIAAIYVGVYERTFELPIWRELSLLDTFLVVLAFILALSIRTTRREQFRLDNQDLLVLIMLLVAPLIASGGGDSEAVARAVVRLAVVLYAAEFVISKVARPRLLSVLCTVAWVLLAIGAWS